MKRQAPSTMRSDPQAANKDYMRLALSLARRGLGSTSPNPMVGAVLVKQEHLIGRGWHRRPGQPHAEIEAIQDARRRGHDPHGATLYVTLEPCSTHGRTGPCTDTIRTAGLRRVVVGAIDPNPRHAGRGLRILREAGIAVEQGLLEPECTRLNEPFNHWIRHRTPLVTVKAALTLDGKIATTTGQSKWITGPRARALAMRLRLHHDAVLVGIRTLLIDDPALVLRDTHGQALPIKQHSLRRIILDTKARTPLRAQVLADDRVHWTTIVVGPRAPEKRVTALEKRVTVWKAPACQGRVDLGWLLQRLGEEQITSLLVEGGGEVHASFLLGGYAQRIAFFYAPIIFGGQRAARAVAGPGAGNWREIVPLTDVRWRRVGPDCLLTARVGRGGN